MLSPANLHFCHPLRIRTFDLAAVAWLSGLPLDHHGDRLLHFRTGQLKKGKPKETSLESFYARVARRKDTTNKNPSTQALLATGNSQKEAQISLPQSESVLMQLKSAPLSHGTLASSSQVQLQPAFTTSQSPKSYVRAARQSLNGYVGFVDTENAPSRCNQF